MMLCLSFLIVVGSFVFVDGEENTRPIRDVSAKDINTRQDGLIRDLVNLLMEERREREKIRNQLHKIKKQIDDLRNNWGNSRHRVGFLAFLTKVKYISGIIKFESVTYNHGNGYNKASGIFICKIPGLYLFHLTIMAGNPHASAEIAKNGSRVVHAFSSGQNTWASGSAICLLKLKQGDSVYVKSNGRFNYHSRVTHFMGLLISADK